MFLQLYFYGVADSPLYSVLTARDGIDTVLGHFLGLTQQRFLHTMELLLFLPTKTDIMFAR